MKKKLTVTEQKKVVGSFFVHIVMTLAVVAAGFVAADKK
jgi:hypothetical protein